jgi:hypothetical protein
LTFFGFSIRTARAPHHGVHRRGLGGEFADVVVVEVLSAPPSLVALAPMPQVAVAALAIVLA